MTDITERSLIRTNYTPEEFIEEYDAAESEERRSEIRETFRGLDGGRFYDFLDGAHNTLTRSDAKRRREFVDNYSAHLIRWIKAFGAVEDLNRFEDIEV